MSQGHGKPSCLSQMVEACQVKGLARQPGKEGGVESSGTLSGLHISHAGCVTREVS